jgi:type IX secretion system PorP/SprF family membrane protein
LKTRINILKLLFIGWLPVVCYSQDARFSQFDANPLCLNPALTGMGIEQAHLLRVVLNYHQQKTYAANNLYAASVDFSLNNKFALGQLITNHQIENTYNSTHFLFSGSYNITGNKNNALLVGLQAGFMQRIFNLNNYTFDSQYSSLNENGFDLNLVTGESFKASNSIQLDVNAGLMYKNDDSNKKLNPFAGAAIFHITQTNQSVTDIFSPTPMRFNLHGGVDYAVSKKITITPQLFFRNQAKINELNAGIYFYDKLNDSTNCEPMIGIMWRLNNTITAHLGLRYKSLTFRISYDISTTALKQYESNNLEISLVYLMKKKSRPVQTQNGIMPVEPITIETPKPEFKSK